MSVIYVKKNGAPSGPISITAAGQSFTIDDSSRLSITVDEADVALALDQNPYVQRKGSGQEYVAPASSSDSTLIQVQPGTPSIGDVLTYTSQGYVFETPTGGGGTGSSTVILTTQSDADPSATDYDDGTLWVKTDG